MAQTAAASSKTQEAPKSVNMKVWKKLFPFLAKYKGRLTWLVFINLVCALIDIILPLFQKLAIDHFIVPGTTENIWFFAGVYALVIALQTFSVIMFSRSANRMEMYLGKDLKSAVFTHLQTLSFNYYNTTPVGYMLARVMSDTSRIGEVIAWGLIDLMWALTYVGGVLFVMFTLNWKLALLVTLVVPPVVLATRFFQKRILTVNRQLRAINSQMTGAFNEGITGARTSKTLVIEDLNDAEFQEITGNLYTKNIHLVRLNALYIPVVLCFSSIATAIVLVQGGRMAMEGVMLLGTLSAFLTYAVNMLNPIEQAARIIGELISTQANVERVTDILETQPTVTDSPEVVAKYGDCFYPKKENWEPIEGNIEFRHVDFHYPYSQEEILHDFNLTVKAGTTVAIVGETGAGKSTLVNLCCRFFEPTGGQILIDGVDYRQRSQLWLHSSLGYVLQTPHLFSGTVKENIRYGKLDATDEEIIAAAKIVSAHEIIEAMDKGYDSDVGEGGDKLSTGEKQLISFARAVLADPRIFVLDEATSSIDTKTEQLIQNAISHLLQNRTSFLIAHRLSTIRQADIILVVRDGQIIEQGTHQQLLEQKGYYHTLYRNQYAKEAAEKLNWQ